MKNKLLGFFIFILALFIISPSKTYALTNNNKINISKTQYDNLLSLGFDDNEIMNMKEKEFNENKNLTGKVVAVSNKYYDKDNKEIFALRGIQNGYIETYYKILRTTITQLSNGNYRYKTTLTWKIIPSTRSYDIITLGMDTSVKAASGLHFQMNYTTNNGSFTSGTYTPKIGNIGMGATYAVPSSSSLSKLSCYIYYDVQKRDATVTVQHARGDYAHATSTISLNLSQNYMISLAGVVLDSSIESYYDSMNESIATWTGTW